MSPPEIADAFTSGYLSLGSTSELRSTFRFDQPVSDSLQIGVPRSFFFLLLLASGFPPPELLFGFTGSAGVLTYGPLLYLERSDRRYLYLSHLVVLGLRLYMVFHPYGALHL